jgi:hypothetical protein
VSASGAFTSRRTTGEGLVPSEMGRKRPLTRLRASRERRRGPPSPRGRRLCGQGGHIPTAKRAVFNVPSFVFIDIPASFLRIVGAPRARESALSRGERVSASGAFTSRRTTGEGLVPSEMGRNRPLTRPATAGEGAVAGHPLPKGEGCLVTFFALKVRFFAQNSAF